MRSSLVWLLPALWLAWPQIDLALVVALLIPLQGALLIAIVSDPISYSRKDGDDGISERRIGVALLLTILLSAAGWGRLEIGLLSPELRLIGCALLAAGYALRVLAMSTNQFFAGVLLIQTERDHRLIDRGPYRFVRHPGNLSAILIALSLPIAIGSLLGAPFSLIAALVVIDRTRKEERFLLERLDGYRAYADRVPARLFPGVY